MEGIWVFGIPRWSMGLIDFFFFSFKKRTGRFLSLFLSLSRRMETMRQEGKTQNI